MRTEIKDSGLPGETTYYVYSNYENRMIGKIIKTKIGSLYLYIYDYANDRFIKFGYSDKLRDAKKQFDKYDPDPFFKE